MRNADELSITPAPDGPTYPPRRDKGGHGGGHSGDRAPRATLGRAPGGDRSFGDRAGLGLGHPLQHLKPHLVQNTSLLRQTKGPRHVEQVVAGNPDPQTG